MSGGARWASPRRTVFVGAVNHEDMPPFFRSAHLTVMLLIAARILAACSSSRWRRHAGGSGQHSGVRTVVEHGSDGLLVDASTHRLATAIQQILADEAARRSWDSAGGPNYRPAMPGR